ncbi:hypothetical protein PybrP1_002141 [[Pythium] brassicae (nom. inval.)]|nr:hypothetical protein PybrP1_002141 [[Pythium] brassicae (nom. inval.)]
MQRVTNSLRHNAKSKTGAKRTGGKSGATFPLPDSFFPQVALDHAQVQLYERQMREIVQRALVEYERHECMGSCPSYVEPWRWLCSVENLITVQHAQNSRTGKPTRSRIFGRIKGDFRQQMDYYYAETSKQLFDWNMAMFGDTLDAAVLCNIHTAGSAASSSRSAEHGTVMYMGIKWVCVNAPRILKRKRDQCFLEYMVLTKDLRGREVGIRVDLPLDIPQCPDFSQQLHVKRVKTHSVMILRAATNDRSSTEIFMTTETKPESTYSSAAYYKRIMSVLKDMVLHVDTSRLSQREVCDRSDWVPRAQRNACSTCQRQFGATQRNHHCRLCGEVICSNCTIQRTTHRTNKKQPVKIKVCLRCVTAMRGSGSAASVDLSVESFKLSDLSKSAISVSVCDSDMDPDDAHPSDWESWASESEFGDDRCRSSIGSLRSTNGETDEARSSSSSNSTLSLSESSSRDKFSFVTSLGVISDRHDEGALVDFSEDLEQLDDVTEVIDTKQMARIPASYGSRTPPEPKPMSRSRLAPMQFSGHSSLPTVGLESLRSLDQSLAEQEALLKQMVLAASNGRSGSTAH